MGAEPSEIDEGLNAGLRLFENRRNLFNERHLSGARRDNRVVAYGKITIFNTKS